MFDVLLCMSHFHRSSVHTLWSDTRPFDGICVLLAVFVLPHGRLRLPCRGHEESQGAAAPFRFTGVALHHSCGHRCCKTSCSFELRPSARSEKHTKQSFLRVPFCLCFQHTHATACQHRATRAGVAGSGAAESCLPWSVEVLGITASSFLILAIVEFNSVHWPHWEQIARRWEGWIVKGLAADSLISL